MSEFRFSEGYRSVLLVGGETTTLCQRGIEQNNCGKMILSIMLSPTKPIDQYLCSNHSAIGRFHPLVVFPSVGKILSSATVQLIRHTS
jgi:hypothetical protein